MRTYCNPAARHWSAAPGSAPARAFHESLPGYAPTPLVDLPSVAAELGVGRVLVKDESARLGLPAFKVLGASWACERVLARQPGARLVTATDGNHGRAVARMAAHFGTSATVFVPQVMLPAWIIEGYQTLLAEVDEALGRSPDLVAVPVGVGSLAQAVVEHYRRPGADHPSVLSVEPDTAACVLASLTQGRPASVPTGATVMAGLNCGTISSSAWPVLRDGCDAAAVVTDEQALAASRELGELGVSSGPCGAATLAGIRQVLTDPGCREGLALPGDAVVVLLSTEGAAG